MTIRKIVKNKQIRNKTDFRLEWLGDLWELGNESKKFYIGIVKKILTKLGHMRIAIKNVNREDSILLTADGTPKFAFKFIKSNKWI